MATIGYVDELDLSAYATARGITLSRPESVTLTLALDYIEAHNYSGYKTDSAQELQFPRNGDTVVPNGIKQAQLECAVIYDRGDDPQGDISQRVTSETVVGAVSVTYSDSGNQETIYRKLDALLSPFIKSGLTIIHG